MEETPASQKMVTIIFRGYSSSTTHPIEIDSEKKVIALTFIIKTLNFIKHR